MIQHSEGSLIYRAAKPGVGPLVRPGDLLNMLLAVIAVIVAAEAVRLIAHSFGHPTLMGIAQRITLDGEGNLATWFSSILLFLAGSLAFLIFRDRRKLSCDYAAYWAGLGIIMCYMSMDEAIAIHELTIRPLRHQFGFSGALYFSWVVPGAVFVCLVAAAYLRFLAFLPRRTAMMMLISGGMFVTGALGMDLFEGILHEAQQRDTVAFWTLTTIEEVLEMISIAFFIYALADYAADQCRFVGLLFWSPED